ncbi:hypothetical protein EJB05_33115, partial [Eragrostis curvula]
MKGKKSTAEEQVNDVQMAPLVEDEEQVAMPLVEDEEQVAMPQWMYVLLRTMFWKPCSRGHKDQNRAEDCIFCLQCHAVFCPHCTHNETGHRLLKIRRYMYRSVVLVNDMQELNIDVSRIQQYKINQQMAVLLRPMRRSKNFRPPLGSPPCKTCGCLLHEEHNLFCSVTCKERADVSQDDFSGPEAERRYRKHQTNMLQPAEADEQQLPEADRRVELLPTEQVETPPVVNPPEPEADKQNIPEAANIIELLAPELVEALPVVYPPGPEADEQHLPEAANIVGLLASEQVEAPPLANPPGLNYISFRNRPRKQANPERAPFY